METRREEIERYRGTVEKRKKRKKENTFERR
jgi:hypothetical protein